MKDIINTIRQEMLKEAGVHFGHPYYNAATMAGINRMVLKKFASYYSVPFPLNEGTEEHRTPWWLE